MKQKARSLAQPPHHLLNDYLIVSTGEAQEAQEAQSSPTNVFPLILTIPFIVLTTLDIILTTMMQLIPTSGRLFRPREI